LSKEVITMRIVVAIVLGIFGGFLTGIVLSQVIGIVGFLLFDWVVGVKYLSIYTAILGAIVAPILATRMQQRAR
jgi:hypothetical protein